LSILYYHVLFYSFFIFSTQSLHHTFELLDPSEHEVLIIFSTANAFHRQIELAGVMQLQKKISQTSLLASDYLFILIPPLLF
jgi:hypothetical protein